MSERKITMKFFDVMDYEKEAAYLSDMHSKGWKFVKITFPGFYHFEKCEPEEIRYQLDYNKDGIAHKEEYVQMFTDMGWEYLFDFVGYSYFRKPVVEAFEDEDIFCDDDSRWDMMKRIFKGRIIPLIALFFLCLLPIFLMNVHEISGAGLSLGEILGRMLAISLIVILYVSIFIRFTVKYFAFKRKLGK